MKPGGIAGGPNIDRGLIKERTALMSLRNPSFTLSQKVPSLRALHGLSAFSAPREILALVQPLVGQFGLCAGMRPEDQNLPAQLVQLIQQRHPDLFPKKPSVPPPLPPPLPKPPILDTLTHPLLAEPVAVRITEGSLERVLTEKTMIHGLQAEPGDMLEPHLNEVVIIRGGTSRAIISQPNADGPVVVKLVNEGMGFSFADLTLRRGVEISLSDPIRGFPFFLTVTEEQAFFPGGESLPAGYTVQHDPSEQNYVIRPVGDHTVELQGTDLPNGRLSIKQMRMNKNGETVQVFVVFTPSFTPGERLELEFAPPKEFSTVSELDFYGVRLGRHTPVIFGRTDPTISFRLPEGMLNFYFSPDGRVMQQTMVLASNGQVLTLNDNVAAVAKLKAEVARVQAAYEGEKALVEARQADLHQAAERVTDLSGSVSDLGSHNRSLAAENATLRANVAQLNAQVSELAASPVLAQAGVDREWQAIESQATELVARWTQLGTDLTELNNQHWQKKLAAEQENEDLIVIKGDIAAVRQGYQDQRDVRTAEVRSRHLEYARLSEQIAALTGDPAAEGRLARLSARLQPRAARYQQDLAASLKSVDEAEDAEIAALFSEFEDTKHRLEGIDVEIGQLSANIMAREADLLASTRELSQVKQNANELIGRQKAALQAHQEQEGQSLAQREAFLRELATRPAQS